MPEGYAKVYTHDCPNGHEWRGAHIGAAFPCPWCAVKRAERAEEAIRIVLARPTPDGNASCATEIERIKLALKRVVPDEEGQSHGAR